MSDPNSSPPAAPPSAPERMPLEEMYPDCFNWKRPRPLKIGIHRDIAAAGYDMKRVRRALGAYCRRPSYLRAMQVGATRIDLQGQPAGVVTKADLELAQASRLPAATPTNSLPNETPIPQENLVPGRLELTVKFSELPRPLQVQGGMKIGLQTNEGVVTAILSPKTWRKLEQAAKDYPHWVAAMNGVLGGYEGGVIDLKNPAVQIFEKKAKPATAPADQPPNAPPPAAPLESAAPPPPAAQALGYTKLTLKGRSKPSAD